MRGAARYNKETPLADRAWRRWTHGLPGLKSIWAPFAEQFVTARAPRRPDETCAVLLLALDNAKNWHALHHGGWVSLAGGHVYVHFTGSGYDDARVYDLVEAFITWLYEEETLEEWDRLWLLGCVDEARAAHGVTTKGHPRVHDPTYEREELDELSALFAQDRGLNEEERVRTLMDLHRVADCLYGGHWLVRFGGLEPLLLFMRLRDGRRQTDDPSFAAAEPPVHATLVVSAAFYRWLGETGRLDVTRALEISETLLGLAAASMDTAHSL